MLPGLLSSFETTSAWKHAATDIAPEISSALLLACKYDVQSLRDLVVNFITTDWPNMPSEFSWDYMIDSKNGYRHKLLDDPESVIVMARHCEELRPLLPTAFYLASTRLFSEDGPSPLLRPDDLRRLLYGRQLMLDAVTVSMRETFRSMSCQHYSAGGGCQLATVGWGDIQAQLLMKADVLEVLKAGSFQTRSPCGSACGVEARSLLENLRAKTFLQLHIFFGFPDIPPPPLRNVSIET